MSDAIQKIEQALINHLQDACGEIANECTRDDASGFMDEAMEAKIKKAKRRGIEDVAGWLADEMYNDADALSDLGGDKLYDLCNGDRNLYKLVAKSIANGTHHAALKKAARGWVEFD